MAVQFGSLFTISTSGKTTLGDWNTKVAINSTFGADGITWIDGGRTSRTIEVPVWIYSGYGTRQQLLTAVELIETKINQKATLTSDSTTYGVCRFVGLRQTHPMHYSAQHASWMFRGVAVFQQARPQ